MTIYIRGSNKFFTSPQEEKLADAIIRAFSTLSGYFKFDKTVVELTFLVPEEAYTDYSSIVSSSRGILATKTRPDYAKNYLNSLDVLNDPREIFKVLLVADQDKRFEFPDVKISPLLSYEIKSDDEIRLKLHKKWVKKDFSEKDLFDYFIPTVVASRELYSKYKLPIVCKAGEEATDLLLRGDMIQTHSDFFNIYDGGSSKGCIHYQDSGGKSLETAFRDRKRL